MAALLQRTKVLFALVAIFLGHFVLAQEVTIKLGNSSIALNEPFTITATIANEQMRNYTNFPDIPGFTKRGTSSNSSTSFVNGKMSMTQSITQNYFPTKEGKFKLMPFQMQVNGKTVQSSGMVIQVGPARQQQGQNSFGWDPFGGDPFEDFFGGNRNKPKEFVDVAEDAFFALTSTHDKVYTGQGFTITLAFYVAENNRAEMAFPSDLAQQMGQIIKKIKQSNCWEENFNIEEIQAQPVVIEGKKFNEYKLFRATYYPLNKDPVLLPSVGLKMIKYKVAKNPNFWNMNSREATVKTFYTKPKVIKVKELPPHPLRDKVAVGNYKLEETVSKKTFVAGKSFNLGFKITGEGNITAIQNPEIPENKVLEIYPPNIRQDINRSGLSVTGAKSFNYFIIPREPGKTELGKYLNWIYFNVKKERYDTLRSRLVLNVKGESIRNKGIGNTEEDDFYALIKNESNDFVQADLEGKVRFFADIILVSLMVITVFMLFKR